MGIKGCIFLVHVLHLASGYEGGQLRPQPRLPKLSLPAETRRFVLRTSILAPLLISSSPSQSRAADLPAQQATGNAIEGGIDIDDALGFKWGGKYRCDAREIGCGSDGKISDAIKTEPVPQLPVGMNTTDICEMDIQIGKYEAGTLRMELFSPLAPTSVQALGLLFEDSYRQPKDSEYATGFTWGALTDIDKGASVSLGISRDQQSYAFARKKGLRKSPDDLTPMDPPPRQKQESNDFFSSGMAGIVSVPRGGLGRDMEVTISTSATRNKRLDSDFCVVGRLVNEESMELLAQLDGMPVQRAYGKDGKPMLKVTIIGVRHSSVSDASIAV